MTDWQRSRNGLTAWLRRAREEYRALHGVGWTDAGQQPVVFLLPRVAEELRVAAWLRHDEWQGYLKTKLCPEGLVVSELVILDQRANAHTTEISAETVARFMTEVIRSGGDPGDYRGKCHSHGSGHALHWSVEDETNISNHCSDWFVSLLLNRQGDMVARLDMVLTTGPGDTLRVTVHDLPIVIDWLGDEVTCQRIGQTLIDRVRLIPPPRRRVPLAADPVPPPSALLVPRPVGDQEQGGSDCAEQR